MIIRYMESDAAGDMLERRWFAAYKRAEAMRAERESMREFMELAEAAWRRAGAQLTALEALRDALGEELEERDAQPLGGAPRVTRHVSSAA